MPDLLGEGPTFRRQIGAGGRVDVSSVLRAATRGGESVASTNPPPLLDDASRAPSAVRHSRRRHQSTPSTTLMTTRRLRARPSGVELSATGFSIP